MRIIDLRIKNFKSIRDMHIGGIENALILVGKNSTGKTAVLDAIRAASGDYVVREEDFQEDFPNIEICISLKIEEEDLKRLHRRGIVSLTADMRPGTETSARRFLPIRMEFCL